MITNHIRASSSVANIAMIEIRRWSKGSQLAQKRRELEEHG